MLSLHRDITLLLTPPKKAGITNHFKSVPPNELFENSRDGNPLDMVARVNKVSTGRKSTINNEEGGPLSQMELFFWSRLEDQLPILLLHVAIPSGWSPSLYLGVLCSSTQGQKGCMILYQPKSITRDFGDTVFTINEIELCFCVSTEDLRKTMVQHSAFSGVDGGGYIN